MSAQKSLKCYVEGQGVKVSKGLRTQENQVCIYVRGTGEMYLKEVLIRMGEF